MIRALSPCQKLCRSPAGSAQISFSRPELLTCRQWLSRTCAPARLACPPCKSRWKLADTQLILQLFASLLGTCGILAQPGTTCSTTEMDEVRELCGLNANQPVPGCSPECVNLVTERVGQCPLSFTDPAMVTLASTCGTVAAAAGTQPCPPNVIDELLSQSAEGCDAFSAAFTTASATPCADLYTNQDLAQVLAACSLSAVLPACEPGVVDELMDLLPDCQRFGQALGAAQCTDESLQAAVQECGTTLPPSGGADGDPLGVLSILNANCPAGVTVGNFQRACW